MKELKDKIITKVFMDDRQHCLVFETDSGEQIAYQAWGDCCSECWFADIIGIDAILNFNKKPSDINRIREVKEIDMDFYDADDGRCRQDVDSVYGYRLTTAIGRTSIAFRNSSNGYYGGEISLYNGPKIDTSKMKQITEDWPA